MALNTSSSSRLVVEDPASLVLPSIGTTNGGHVFPGNTLKHASCNVCSTKSGYVRRYSVAPSSQSILLAAVDMSENRLSKALKIKVGIDADSPENRRGIRLDS
ncbi:hypothetical protein E1B28_005486 [Marasmius oreades]|uniref:Uncharacterized protein n=1 Tax=Marasmius oreades TaxID=181124 RepID=A0A9P7S3B7_9AGAR|nr:uncharacterized protein E1B28_005486 [Marasmius oreades]KAG7094664.1 hypothetical protein E1B28_005486 [Marasmius oreades]